MFQLSYYTIKSRLSCYLQESQYLSTKNRVEIIILKKIMFSQSFISTFSIVDDLKQYTRKLRETQH